MLQGANRFLSSSCRPNINPPAPATYRVQHCIRTACFAFITHFIVLLTLSVLQCKTFAIGPDESARDCVKIALDHLEMRDADPSQYQLWAKTPREEPPYPLFGHEKPYSVKLSCLRDGISAEEGFDLDHCNNVHDPLARCHFILRCVTGNNSHPSANRLAYYNYNSMARVVRRTSR